MCARFREKKWYAHSSQNQKCFWLLIHKKKPFQKSRKRHFTDISINFLCKSAEYCVILHLIYSNMSTRHCMKKSHVLFHYALFILFDYSYFFNQYIFITQVKHINTYTGSKYCGNRFIPHNILSAVSKNRPQTTILFSNKKILDMKTMLA